MKSCCPLKKESKLRFIIIFFFKKLNILIAKNKIFDFMYLNYFRFLTFLRTNKWGAIKRKKNFYVVSEIINKNKIIWFFPNSLRLRGLNSYNGGIIKAGKFLAQSYKINKITFNDDDIVLDCGANLSDLLIFLGSLNLRIQYHAIEPGEIEIKALRLNLGSYNFKKVEKYLHEYALGDSDQFKTFYYAPEAGDSSLIKPRSYYSTYQVKSITLDSLAKLENFNDKKIKLLKLEAEGLEPEILKGAKNILKNIEYIAADLGPERGISEECTVVQVSKILFENGFEMIEFGHPRITALYKNINYE